MADIEKDSDGRVVKVTYKDSAGYTLEVDRRSPVAGKVRIVSKSPSGSGCPADLAPAEARRFAHDVLEVIGGEDG